MPVVYPKPFKNAAKNVSAKQVSTVFIVLLTGSGSCTMPQGKNKAQIFFDFLIQVLPIAHFLCSHAIHVFGAYKAIHRA